MRKPAVTMMILFFVLSVCSFAAAQAPFQGEGDFNEPMMDDPIGSQDGMRPGMGPGKPGMMPPGMPRKNRNPEDEKKQARMQSVMATAEAHKNLARLYEQQNKIDEAAAELRKIIALTSEEMGRAKDDPGMMRGVKGKIIPVYHEIARLYLKNDRLADADKVINEGIALFEKDDPVAATKLILHLGEIHKKNNDLAKAEAAFKRVIELNQKNLK